MAKSEFMMKKETQKTKEPTTMTMINQSKRAFILKPGSIIKGGEKSQDGNADYFNPGTTAIIEIEVAKKLVKNYKKDFLVVK